WKADMLGRGLTWAGETGRGQQSGSQGSKEPCKRPFAQAPLYHKDRSQVPGAALESHAARLRQRTPRPVQVILATGPAVPNTSAWLAESGAGTARQCTKHNGQQ